jgi:hypothetical protein
MSTADALQDDLRTAYARFLARRAARRRMAAVTILGAAAALALATTGIGAARLLGWPAPDHVKREIAAVDRGMPADLRLNPDVAHARAVASTPSATLYAASLRGGGSCTEIVTDGDRGRGATCTTSAAQDGEAVGLVAPSDEAPGPDTAIVIGGRLNAEAGATLEAAYADGSTDAVELGEDRYFLLEVPAAQRASVHASGLELVARDRSGAVVGRATLPADWDDAAVPDERAPLFVSTRSDESDFTKVYGIEGHVGADRAAKLQLDYGDGEQVAIPIRPDGSYEYTVPRDRIDAFMRPRMLVARDANDAVVASAPVAAVAYWRGQERRSP